MVGVSFRLRGLCGAYLVLTLTIIATTLYNVNRFLKKILFFLKLFIFTIDRVFIIIACRPPLRSTSWSWPLMVQKCRILVCYEQEKRERNRALRGFAKKKSPEGLIHRTPQSHIPHNYH